MFETTDYSSSAVGCRLVTSTRADTNCWFKLWFNYRNITADILYSSTGWKLLRASQKGENCQALKNVNMKRQNNAAAISPIFKKNYWQLTERLLFSSFFSCSVCNVNSEKSVGIKIEPFSKEEEGSNITREKRNKLHLNFFSHRHTRLWVNVN